MASHRHKIQSVLPIYKALEAGNYSYLSVYSVHVLHIQLSLQNHCIERMWVEINGRVNYPIKAMEARSAINMDCAHEKFCVS